MSVPGKANWSDLAIRLTSAVVLAVLALGATWWGGLVFSCFWLLAALAVFAEWQALIGRTGKKSSILLLGCLFLTGATLSLFYGLWAGAVLLLVLGTILLKFVAGWHGADQPLLAAIALPYAGAVVLPAVALRQAEPYGMIAILVLFAIVWGSDIMAYFTGRFVGGPRLWPRISPKKTWAGFLGGVVFGGFAAGLIGGSVMLFFIGMGLAALSQGGDLFESSLKRRFDTKDTSSLIPGHGGVMDRLDGFLVAALAALALGLIRAGGDPAAGFVVW